MKKTEEIMEILAAYDLTHSFRDAAAGGRHKCVQWRHNSLQREYSAAQLHRTLRVS